MAVINTNVKSLIAADSLRASNTQLAQAMERLSTGKKINSAKDDAAGLAISSRMTAQVRGLNMAIKNANDGINLAQTAEGAMGEITSMLQRMRELSVQAGNGTNSDTDRAAMNDEVTQLKTEIDRISKTTQFNGMNILDGSFAGKLQIGNNSSQTMGVAIAAVNTASMGETATGLAKTSTKAVLTVGGASTNAADYQGASFNANINGVVKNITLPVASAKTVQTSGATSTLTPAVADAVVDVSSSGQIGAVLEKSVDMTTATNGKLQLAVGLSGAQNIDISSATYYKNAKTATGAEIVSALQTEINKNSFFQGPNAVKVSLNTDGRITFGMASGAANTITLSSDATSAGTFMANVVGNAATATNLANGVNSSELTAAATTKDLSANTAFRVAGQNLDLGAAIASNNFKASALTVDEFVKVYNQTAKVNGQQLSSASASADGTVTFSISSPVASTDPLANGNAVTSLSVSSANKTLSFQDATGKLGQNPLTITAGTNDVLKVAVNGGNAAALTLSPSASNPYMSMQDVAVEIQKQANKIFTGVDAITVSAVQDSDKNWGLKFSNALGRQVALSGSFMDSTAATSKFANYGINFDNSTPASVAVDGGSSAPTVKVTTASAVATAQIADFTFGNLTKGSTLQIGGATLTALSDLTAQELATAFGGKASGGAFTNVAGKYTVAGTLTTASSSAASGNVVTFTSAAVNNTNPPVVVTGSSIAVNNSSFPASVGTAAFKLETVDLSTAVNGLLDVTVNGGTVQKLDLSTSITKLGYTNSTLTGTQLVNVLNDTFTSAGMVGINGVTASINSAGQLAFQAGNPQNGSNPSVTIADGSLGGAAGKFVSTVTVLGATSAAGAITASTTITSDVSGNAVLSTSTTDTEKFGVSNLKVVTGTNDVMSVTIGSNPKVNLTVTPGTYTDATALVNELNRQATNSGALSGSNAVSFSVIADASGNQGIKATSVTGSAITFSGTMMTAASFSRGTNTGGLGLNDLSTTGVTFPAANTATGGINLSAGNAVTLSVTDASGAQVTKSFNMAGTGANVSYASYAADLQSAANTAFAGTGLSFATSTTNGKLGFSVNNATAASFSASGSAITSAFGSAINGSAPTQALDVNKFGSMADVAKEITKDLGGAAVASFDAASNSWSFAVNTGDAGTTSNISLSGAGLAGLQIGGALSATGSAGEASAGRLSNVNVLTTDAATAALGSIDNSIEYISKQRSMLGAIANRLSYTVNNLTNIVTNTEASRSAIEDTDYSKETTALAKQQIITQAATAMLAQANQSSQSVLSLLK